MTPRFVLIPLLALAALATGLWTLTGRADQNESLTLGFTSTAASPVVLTDFAIEQDLAPIEPTLVAGQADLAMPRMEGTNALTPPVDKGGDGIWSLSARWVELTTDRAYTARIDVPKDALTVAYGSYLLLVVFSPNGELLIASDTPGSSAANRRDVARTCADRAPEADRAWREDTGAFPEMGMLMAELARHPNPPAFCPEGRPE